MCDKLENRGDLIFGILVKKLKYIDVFFILGIVYHHWTFSWVSTGTPVFSWDGGINGLLLSLASLVIA